MSEWNQDTTQEEPVDAPEEESPVESASSERRVRIMNLNEGIVLYDLDEEGIIDGPFPDEAAAEKALAEVLGNA